MKNGDGKVSFVTKSFDVTPEGTYLVHQWRWVTSRNLTIKTEVVDENTRTLTPGKVHTSPRLDNYIDGATSFTIQVTKPTLMTGVHVQVGWTRTCDR